MRHTALLVATLALAGCAGTDPGLHRHELKDSDLAGRSDVTCQIVDAPTGSLIGSRRVCHTEAQWAAIEAQARRAQDGYGHTNVGINGGSIASGNVAH